MNDTIRFIADATTVVTGVVRGCAGAAPSSSTPCGEFDLAALVNHMAGTTGALADVGERRTLDPEDPWGSRTEIAAADWPQALADRLARLGAVWSRKETWEGTVAIGDSEMPASSIGDTAFIEVLVHGWDLARTTGQALDVPADMAAELRRVVEETADLGRQLGAYGEQVLVPETASDIDVALGAAGRDPAWTPQRAVGQDL